MAFTNRLAIITPSMGSPLHNDSIYLSEGNSITSSISVSMENLSPTVRAGYVRVKISAAAGTTPTMTNLKLAFDDDTTTEVIYNHAPETALASALSSTVNFDVVVPFLLDIDADALTISGALGGSSPTATMDVEIAATSGNS